MIVERDTAPMFVIGNFQRLGAPAVPEHLLLVQDFGNGLMLFRKGRE